jgi:aquaporin TIP
MLPDSLCKLTLLKHLNLSFCVKLERLPSSIGDLKLQNLDLEGCIFLGDLPDSIFNLSTPVYVQRIGFGYLIVCSKINELRKKVNIRELTLDGGSGDLWGQIVELENTDCHDLYIKGLENVKHLEGAEEAKISNNSSLMWLSLTWEHDKGSLVGHADAMADKSVLEKLVPPRSLQVLHLDGYMSMDFPRWMLDIPSYLPHLTNISLSKLKGCSRLPPLGCLPSLRAFGLSHMPDVKRVGREFYGHYGSCQRLRMIVLIRMDNLEEWRTTRSSTEEGEFLIPNLLLLCVVDCPKLRFLPYPPRSMKWTLLNSEHVLPEHGFGKLSSTTSPFSLLIGGTSVSSEGWRQTQHLSSIEDLGLDSVTGLRNLPDDIRCFKSLRKLGIQSCEDLETLPEWLGDLTSLREIRIFKCPKLSSLPESIRGLTELKKLRIIDCPELFEKCQGEDKHKIAHIPEVTSE